MKTKIITAILFVGMIAAGCRAVTGAICDKGSVGQESLFSLAGTLVKELFDSYQDFALEDFTAKVAADFVPSRNDLVNNAASNIRAAKVLDIDFSLDQALSDKDLLAIDLKWQKRTRPYDSNNVVLTEGFAQAVFKKVSGQWLLYQINKDNPF